MAASTRRPTIWVLAGANGAGKSSVGGARFRASGGDYYNPDEAAATLRSLRPELDQQNADSAAWGEGKRLLERAIAERGDFVIETTLGGTTMLRLFQDAAALGFDIKVWFVGLASADLNIARVRSREAHGGHPVAEEAIRRRYDSSRENLINLIPFLAELRVYDNSEEGDPARGIPPKPRLLLHLVRGQIQPLDDASPPPDWVKPILAAASNLVRA